MLPLEICKSTAYDLEIDDKVDFDRTLVVFYYCTMTAGFGVRSFEVISRSFLESCQINFL